jgi:hypothetical protein
MWVDCDALEDVLAKHNVTELDFVLANPAYNPHLIDAFRINAGEKLNIPPCTSVTLPQYPTEIKCGFNYTLVEGDNVWQLAQFFGVSISDVMWANPELPTLLDMTPGPWQNPQHSAVLRQPRQAPLLSGQGHKLCVGSSA